MTKLDALRAAVNEEIKIIRDGYPSISKETIEEWLANDFTEDSIDKKVSSIYLDNLKAAYRQLKKQERKQLEELKAAFEKK